MGHGHYSADMYDSISKTKSYKTKSASSIFATSLTDAVNPAKFKNGIRECRDSDDHPRSIPIIIALDVTGSMGRIPENLIKVKFPEMLNIMMRHNVTDAQICFAAVGDHYSDRVPLQMGQFEQDTAKLLEMLENFYIEGGGGGQTMESYPLAWYAAAYHTSTDSFEKRGIKGFLFTIGDESFHKKYEAKSIQQIFNLSEAGTIHYTAEQLYAAVSDKFHVFHIHCNDGSYTIPKLGSDWTNLLGERLLQIDDSNDVSELIATTVAVINGAEMDNILSTLNTTTASNLTKALTHVSSSLATLNKTTSSGIVAL
jgi:hypothetical protein